MTTWFNLSTPSQTERLEEAWPGAPVEQVELCSMLLDIAKEQVIEYAPKPSAEEGEIIQGPVTVARRNLFPSPGGQVASRFTVYAGTGSNSTVASLSTEVSWAVSTLARRFTWTAVSAPNDGDIGISLANIGTSTPLAPGEVYTLEFDIEPSRAGQVTAAAPYASTGTYEIIARSSSGIDTLPTGPTHRWITVRADAASLNAGLRVVQSMRGKTAGDWMQIGNVVLYPGPKVNFPFFDGATPAQGIYSYAWTGAENNSTSVESYRPNVFVPTYPDRLVYAQLQQAQNLWNAGQANPNGDMGPDTFSFTPRPLDKTIRGIIRPTSGAASVF